MNTRMFGLLAIAMLVVAALFSAQGLAAKGDDGRTILEFDTMVGVSAPYTGATNPIRGIPGGGIPWVLRSAKGELKQSGKLEVKVQGLVLATTLANPVATFKSTVSCLSSTNGAPTTVNVSTAPVPATTGLASAGGGNAEIEAMLDLPHPCIAPIIFVANGASGAWFSATGS